jgi:hypothetical protein
LILERHRAVVDEDGHGADVTVERRLHLDAHEVGGVLQPDAAVFVRRGQPSRSDDGDHQIAVSERLAYGIDEVVAGEQRVDVDENIVVTKLLLEPVVQAARLAGRIFPAITNEYLRHGRFPAA